MEGTSEEHQAIMDLPPGFRFHPTDEEIISEYLSPKVINGRFSAAAIGEVDMNKCEPWDLPNKAKMGEKEWYFYCNRDRKYPTGMRTNRATESGYWKATGKDKEIYKVGKSQSLIGMKKTLVFYQGRAPKGEKSNWVMHEYRLEGEFSYYKFPNKDEWVVCRIFHKNPAIKQNPFMFPTSIIPYEKELSLLEYCSDISPLPPLVENQACSSLINEGETVEATTKASSALSVNTNGENYHSYISVNIEDHHLQNHNTNHFTPQNYNSQFNSIKYDYSSNLYPQIQLQNNDYLIEGENLVSTFEDHEISRAFKEAQTSMGVEKQCMVEQLSSNQSRVSVSNDTGISTAETSSRPSDRIYELSDITDLNLEGPKNVSNGLDYLWDYQN